MQTVKQISVMCKCVYVFKWSVSGDIIQIQQRGFHSGRHISEGWDLDLGAKYHILTLLEELYSTKQDTDLVTPPPYLWLFA